MWVNKGVRERERERERLMICESVYLLSSQGVCTSRLL